MSTVALESNKKVWGGGQSPFNLSYGKIMMWYFLMSDAFTFGAFLISYGTTRFFSSIWPDANSVFKSFPFCGDMNLPLMFVSLMTFILIISSVTMVLAVHAGHCRDKNGVIKWMVWTIIGGIAFLSCQAWEWTNLIATEHMTISTNPFGSHIEDGTYNVDEHGHPYAAGAVKESFTKGRSYIIH